LYNSDHTRSGLDSFFWGREILIIDEGVLHANPFAQFEDKADGDIPTATLKIYEFINEYLARDSSTNVLRASAANLCVRRRWYTKNGFEPEPMTPRKIVNFLLGDLSERCVLYFIKQALVGEGKLYSEVDFGDVLGSIHFQNKEIEIYKQKPVHWLLSDGETEVIGHADGFGRRSSDGKWELIEIKSAADYGFDKFKKEGPGDYLNQAHTLMKARFDTVGVRFFYLRKSTGHLYDRYFQYDPDISLRVEQEFMASIQAEIPEPPYDVLPQMKLGKPTGVYKLQWQCSYCGFMRECKKDYDIKTDFTVDRFGHTKPSFLLKPKNKGAAQ